MGDTAPRDLISLTDDEGNSVTVNVLGRDPGWSAGLDAEIVTTPFVSSRIDLTLYASKLESCANALNKLDADEDVAWTEMSNGPSIFMQLAGAVAGSGHANGQARHRLPGSALLRCHPHLGSGVGASGHIIWRGTSSVQRGSMRQWSFDTPTATTRSPRCTPCPMTPGIWNWISWPGNGLS